jgi:hypothetical protein
MKEKLTKLPLELLPRMQTKFFYYRNKRLRRAMKTQVRKEERLEPTDQKAGGRAKLKTPLTISSRKICQFVPTSIKSLRITYVVILHSQEMAPRYVKKTFEFSQRENPRKSNFMKTTLVTPAQKLATDRRRVPGRHPRMDPDPGAG